MDGLQQDVVEKDGKLYVTTTITKDEKGDDMFPVIQESEVDLKTITDLEKFHDVDGREQVLKAMADDLMLKIKIANKALEDME